MNDATLDRLLDSAVKVKILTCYNDIFRDDGVMLASRFKTRPGKNFEHEMIENQFHAWVLFATNVTRIPFGFDEFNDSAAAFFNHLVF